MNIPPRPFDFLEQEDYEHLKRAVNDNHVQNNEYRPLEQFDRCTRAFARDYLRNYFKSNEKEITEEEILNFERETYGNP
jgi:hypothetical protein